jgi:hypothetical protein
LAELGIPTVAQIPNAREIIADDDVGEIVVRTWARTRYTEEIRALERSAE